MVRKIKIAIPQKYYNTRLDKFLTQIFQNIPYSNLQRLIRKKDIKVNERRTELNYRLTETDTITIPEFIYQNLKLKYKISKPVNKKTISEIETQNFIKTIIYKDANIIVINKSQGLSVQGGSNIKISVADYLPYLKFENTQTPKLVHRIDKDTSGLLLIARNSQTAEKLTKLFKQRNKIRKIYLTIVIGKLSKDQGIISYPLIKKSNGGIEKVYKDNQFGKEAITNFKLLSYSKKYNVSLVEAEILTGRTHQIRVHFKEFGHPILGDGKYGGKKAFVEDLDNTIHLHSHKIEIKELGLNIKADIPIKFLRTIKKAGLKIN
jgi:23S rRNA pseudouridine955/2504/2580 synthase